MDENGILFMDDENVVPFWLIHDGTPYSAATTTYTKNNQFCCQFISPAPGIGGEGLRVMTSFRFFTFF